MSKLTDIQENVQHVAKAIASVLGVETIILDNTLTIVAGTGKFTELIGSKDAEAYVSSEEFLYTHVLKSGQIFVIDNPEEKIYGPQLIGEIGEICCPIKQGNSIIGIISLVAFDENQYTRLISQKDPLSSFLDNMATLLAAQVNEKETNTRLSLESSLLNKIVESIGDGIMVVDCQGIITHCNSAAQKIIKKNSSELLGLNINDLWPGSFFSALLESESSFLNREEIFDNGSQRFHLLVTAVPIRMNNKIEVVIISFKDIVEARHQAYHLTNTHYCLEFDSIKGTSKSLINVKDLALRVAKGNSTVLINGESGTGKEMFAVSIHHASPRKDKPFVIVNCGAIPETLLESELFGYDEGAFTGARKGGRPGKFELAHGGTIFLDEIGDLPLHLQVKLLHVLQRKKVERVGGNKVIDVDVRVIAASNRNLELMCQSGEFREDLYYRLSVIPIHIPPLRERKDDIYILALHFLEKYSAVLNKRISGFSDKALTALTSYSWPGNVRELENAVEYGVNLTTRSIICLDNLPPKIKQRTNCIDPDASFSSLKEKLAEYEEKILLHHLKNLETEKITRDELAKMLGISRASLYRKLKNHLTSQKKMS